jgi:hypothetical protein
VTVVGKVEYVRTLIIEFLSNHGNMVIIWNFERISKAFVGSFTVNLNPLTVSSLYSRFKLFDDNLLGGGVFTA